jgi:hypothetical protein
LELTRVIHLGHGNCINHRSSYLYPFKSKRVPLDRPLQDGSIGSSTFSSGWLVVGLFCFSFWADQGRPFWSRNIQSTVGHRTPNRSSRDQYCWIGNCKTVRWGGRYFAYGWLVVGLCLFPQTPEARENFRMRSYGSRLGSICVTGDFERGKNLKFRLRYYTEYED